jgi:phosphatidylserine synthase
MRIKSIFTSILTPPDRFINWIAGKGFGLKDIFTMVNLGGGIVGIVLAMMGRPVDASYAIMIGFLGDTLDGAVARITNSSNDFGTDFDTITDHLSQCIAPAFVVFAHFRPYSFKIAAALLFIIIASGSIRHARNTAVKFSFETCWKGLPRPVATMFIFGFLNSRLLTFLPYSNIIGIVFIILICYGLLTDYHFVNHHGRKLQLWVILFVVISYTIGILQAIFYRVLLWDTILLIVALYSFGGLTVLSKKERDQYWAKVKIWKTELERKQ